MAIKVYTEDSEAQGQWRPWRDGIEFLVRAVPQSVRDRFEREYTRGLKARQIGEQSATTAREKALALTRQYAAYALLDSRGPEIAQDKRGPGFELEVPPSKEFISEFSQALGEPVKAGDLVNLDGRWSEALKSVVFSYVPLQKWLSDEADKVAGYEAQEEAELGKT